MENLEIIRKAYGIHGDLRLLASALLDEGLRDRVVAVQSTWRELTHAISASACGVDSDLTPEPTKRRGRGKAKRRELIPLESRETSGNSGIATASHTPTAS